MKTGKISESILKRSVLKKCRGKRKEIFRGAGVGNDSALLDMRQSALAACAVHPEVIEQTINIRYGVEHAVNNLACSGCLPAAVMLSFLLPAGTEEAQLKALMEEADNVCAALGVAIAGGHTEVSAAVRLPVLTVTAIGTAEDCGAQAFSGSEALSGADLVIAGCVGSEGSTLLALAHERELAQRFPVAFVEEAKRLAESISIVKAARIAQENGALAMHDASTGGIFGALWEFCEREGVGMEADLREIPIRQETIEVCEFFGYHPYCLRSGGALIIAAEDGKRMAAVLREQGVRAKVIGRLTEENGRILRNGEEKRFLERPAQDEFEKERAKRWQN